MILPARRAPRFPRDWRVSAVAKCPGRSYRCGMPEPNPANRPTEADAYQDFFVPALFLEWGPRMVAAAGLRPGQRVLDLACGTGVLARAAAIAVQPGGSVVGLDPNAAMLAVAARLSPELEWREGRAESLQFPDASFDAVVSQFGLMFFGDRTAALRELWRVLRPGGRLAIAVCGSLADTPVYAAGVALIERWAGPAAAAAMQAPFALGDEQRFRAVFADAGIPIAAVRTEVGTGVFPSIRALVEADLRGWLPIIGVVLPDETIAGILAEAEVVMNPFRDPDGTVRFDSPALIATGSKAD